MSKEEVEEYGRQSKCLDHEKIRLGYLVETLKDPNDLCECIIALLSLLNINKEKIKYISMALSNSKKKYREKAAGVKAW